MRFIANELHLLFAYGDCATFFIPKLHSVTLNIIQVEGRVHFNFSIQEELSKHMAILKGSVSKPSELCGSI